MGNKRPQTVRLIPEELNVNVYIYPRNPVTICEIYNRRTGRLITYGISRCKISHNAEYGLLIGDSYDPVTGMRLALKSALGRMTRDMTGSDSAFQMTDEAKKIIWRKFFKLYPPSNNVQYEREPVMAIVVNDLKALIENKISSISKNEK